MSALWWQDSEEVAEHAPTSGFSWALLRLSTMLLMFSTVPLDLKLPPTKNLRAWRMAMVNLGNSIVGSVLHSIVVELSAQQRAYHCESVCLKGGGLERCGVDGNDADTGDDIGRLGIMVG